MMTFKEAVRLGFRKQAVAGKAIARAASPMFRSEMAQGLRTLGEGGPGVATRGLSWLERNLLQPVGFGADTSGVGAYQKWLSKQTSPEVLAAKKELAMLRAPSKGARPGAIKRYQSRREILRDQLKAVQENWKTQQEELARLKQMQIQSERGAVPALGLGGYALSGGFSQPAQRPQYPGMGYPGMDPALAAGMMQMPMPRG